MYSRIKRLESAIKDFEKARRPTVFTLETGEVFTTTLGPLDYIVQHGVETPKGRIVAYPHPVDGVDGLSLSLYELVDDAIFWGGIHLDTEGDEPK